MKFETYYSSTAADGSIAGDTTSSLLATAELKVQDAGGSDGRPEQAMYHPRLLIDGKQRCISSWITQTNEPKEGPNNHQD